MHVSFWYIIIVGACIGRDAFAARVLVMPLQGTSHIIYMSAIGDEMAKKGHDVYTLLSPAMSLPSSVIKGPSTKLYYKITDEELHDIEGPEIEKLWEAMIQWEVDSADGLRYSDQYMEALCTNPLKDNNLLEKLKSLKLDIAIVDGFPAARCFYVLLYKLGIPYVSVTTQYEPWLYRVPAIPSFVPFAMRSVYTERMSFFERLMNTYKLVDWVVRPGLKNMDNSIVSQYASDLPYCPIDDLARKSLIWFFNTDDAIDYPKPRLPNMVNIGGLTTKPAKPLPPDLETFMKKSKEGVILVSFGSLGKNIPPKYKTIMLNALKKVDLNVIYKTEQPDTEIPQNILIRNWIPQNDLLGHNKTRLFITHAGNNGQFEALYHGVPMVAIPIFGEQPYNAMRAVYKGYGVSIKLKYLSEKDILASIYEVLNNDKYKTNIQRGSAIYRSRQDTPIDRAVYWIEHVLQFGGSHLRSYAMDIPWYEYIMLDIFLFLALVFLVLGYALYKTCKILFSFFSENKMKKD